MKTRTKKGAARAASAIRANGRLRRNAKLDESNLIDVLTDLRHWADHNDVDFFEALESSYHHYLAERDLDRRNAHTDDVGEYHQTLVETARTVGGRP